MPAILGVKIDPLNGSATPNIDELGKFGWVRFVAQLDRAALAEGREEVAPEIRDYVHQLKQTDPPVRSLVVLARESFIGQHPTPEVQSRIAALYADQLQ